MSAVHSHRNGRATAAMLLLNVHKEKLKKITKTGMMPTEYMGGLTARYHSFRRLSSSLTGRLLCLSLAAFSA